VAPISCGEFVIKTMKNFKSIFFSHHTVDSLIWKPYANAPVTDGFFVGKNQKGFDIYVGQGTYGDDRAPGNIQPGGSAGFYMVNGGVERQVMSGASYLVVPSTCECKWISNTVAANATGMIVVVRGPGLTYWVGRHTFAGGAMTIGKVIRWVDPVPMGYADNGAELNTLTYDAMQCLVKEQPCGESSWIKNYFHLISNHFWLITLRVFGNFSSFILFYFILFNF
jgi:hypothetical protein